MIKTYVFLPFYAKLAFILLAIAALGFFVVEGKEILDPLLFGFLFAILLLPAGNFFEHRFKMPRSVASFTSILLMGLFIYGIIYLVGSQVANLTNDWPQLKQQVSNSAADLQDWIADTFHVNKHSQTAYVRNATNKIMASGTAVLGTTFGAVSGLALFFAFILIFTFLIMIYRRLLFRFVLQAASPAYEPVVHDIMENIQKVLRQYILGLLLEMTIVAGAACGAFFLIGVKYAALLGIITALFNIIPYIGIFTALLLSTAITFATGALTKALVVAVCVIGIHAVDANLLLPMIVGSKVRLNALITFLGIVLGEMIWGLSGMFLSIPTIAILKIIFDRVPDMKPWGYLLGGDYEYNTAAKEDMKTE